VAGAAQRRTVRRAGGGEAARPPLLDAWTAERFRREGVLLAHLTHPNVARLLDAGVAADEQPYLVLEYVAGRQIDVYCEEERLTPERRLALFQQVLAAVGHAHASLVVHRDIKPSNILVAADGTVKLLDFGIATLLDDGSAVAERTELTAAAGLPLTPRFAAPEQIADGRVTTATDVYALGVLLFLLLTGRHPTGDGATTADAQLRATLEVEPPRLSVAAPAPLRRRYRGDLDTIVARALKKAPAERYQTVEAFAEDLRRHLATSRCSRAPTPSATGRASSCAATARPSRSGAAAAVALLAAAGRRHDADARRAAAARRGARAAGPRGAAGTARARLERLHRGAAPERRAGRAAVHHARAARPRAARWSATCRSTRATPRSRRSPSPATTPRCRSFADQAARAAARRLARRRRRRRRDGRARGVRARAGGGAAAAAVGRAHAGRGSRRLARAARAGRPRPRAMLLARRS
jgi:hypothetical protein